jgi:hypothetical protein
MQNQAVQRMRLRRIADLFRSLLRQRVGQGFDEGFDLVADGDDVIELDVHSRWIRQNDFVAERFLLPVSQGIACNGIILS